MVLLLFISFGQTKTEFVLSLLRLHLLHKFKIRCQWQTHCQSRSSSVKQRHFTELGEKENEINEAHTHINCTREKKYLHAAKNENHLKFMFMRNAHSLYIRFLVGSCVFFGPFSMQNQCTRTRVSKYCNV